MAGVQVIPSAKRLITSLRDMGYDFAQAVADVVDNSIEAGASLVAIDIEFDGDDSWVRIADNGKGMRPDELREAMRYGAEREYDDADLGKFGLGLKTASMSQCQRLSVASRWNPDRADLSAYAWDLDHISKTNRWEILPIERNGMGPAIRQPLKDHTGTVVLWQKLDRILGYKQPYGEMARKRLSQMCRDVEVHLGMVFHRFLAGEVRRKSFKLMLNGNEILPWDPFCKGEAKTKLLQSIILPIEHEGIAGQVELHPFILPHQDDFSSVEAFQCASGPANWNQQQGFYIYRAGRMIQSGGWSNLRAPDEHTKLARIAVNFSPKFDDAFKINVAKMRVQLPSQLRDEVRQAISPVVKIAREVYDKKSSKTQLSAAGVAGVAGAQSHVKSSVPQTSGSSVPCSMEDLKPKVIESNTLPENVMLTASQWATRMMSVASDDERPIVSAVLERVATYTGIWK